jgi:hypothetical protein
MCPTDTPTVTSPVTGDSSRFVYWSEGSEVAQTGKLSLALKMAFEEREQRSVTLHFLQLDLELVVRVAPILLILVIVGIVGLILLMVKKIGYR